MALARRGGGGGGSRGPTASPADDEFWQHFPALWEFLLLDCWPADGGARETGSLLLFVQDGYVKARLVDQDADEVAFWSFGGLWEALQGLNDALAAGTGDWRKQRPWNERGKGNGRK